LTQSITLGQKVVAFVFIYCVTSHMWVTDGCVAAVPCRNDKHVIWGSFSIPCTKVHNFGWWHWKSACICCFCSAHCPHFVTIPRFMGNMAFMGNMFTIHVLVIVCFYRHVRKCTIDHRLVINCNMIKCLVIKCRQASSVTVIDPN